MRVRYNKQRRKLTAFTSLKVPVLKTKLLIGQNKSTMSLDTYTEFYEKLSKRSKGNEVQCKGMLDNLIKRVWKTKHTQMISKKGEYDFRVVRIKYNVSSAKIVWTLNVKRAEQRTVFLNLENKMLDFFLPGFRSAQSDLHPGLREGIRHVARTQRHPRGC